MAPELSTDVLIVGAGPAGSAAAQTLVRNGLKVALVDRFDFPREKVCGDALIPDAFDALKSLALEAAVRAEARVLDQLRIYAPNGTYVSLSGQCACLPRERFDQILREAAVHAGALFLSPYNVKEVLATDRINGAVFQHRVTREDLKILSRMTLVATGAGVEGLTQFSVAERREPSAVALRAYFQVPTDVDEQFNYLCISYDKSIVPGYGWIFPGPNGVFNLGVGWFLDTDKHSRRPNLTELWRTFAERFEPARSLLGRSIQKAPFKGAPLRTAMTGARFSKPGLLVIGEAAGLTYSFSGEGIGKAMASGIIAGELIAHHWKKALSLEGIGAVYQERLTEEFGARFHAYRLAQRWLESPAFANFLAWRANRSPFVRNQLEGLFTETANPQTLFSVQGILRSLFQYLLIPSAFVRHQG